MMLSDFRDWIKTIFAADSYQIGKIDGKREKAVGIYPGSPLAQIEAFGGCNSYGTAPIRILIHWNRNMRETETAARDLYNKLKHISDIDMGEIHCQYLYLLQDEPVFVGTDDNGVYEYVIQLTIYYRR